LEGRTGRGEGGERGEVVVEERRRGSGEVRSE